MIAIYVKSQSRLLCCSNKTFLEEYENNYKSEYMIDMLGYIELNKEVSDSLNSEYYPEPIFNSEGNLFDIKTVSFTPAIPIGEEISVDEEKVAMAEAIINLETKNTELENRILELENKNTGGV